MEDLKLLEMFKGKVLVDVDYNNEYGYAEYALFFSDGSRISFCGTDISIDCEECSARED